MKPHLTSPRGGTKAGISSPPFGEDLGGVCFQSPPFGEDLGGVQKIILKNK